MAKPSGAMSVVTLVVGLAAAAFAGTFGKELANSFFSQNRSVTSQANLNKVAADVNKNTPLMVDKETELMNALGLEGVLVYNYRLVNMLSSEIPAAELIATLQTPTSQQVCSTPQTRDGLLKRGVTMRYSYYDKNKVYIAAFDVTPASCGF